MKKTRLRVVSFLLTIILTITSMPINVLASKSEVIAKENVRKIIESDFSDIHNIEYIYEENGEVFKAVENINKDFDKVESKIFKKINDEFILLEELETVLKENEDNLEILSMNLTTGKQRISISEKPVEKFETIDRLPGKPLNYSNNSPYPRYETYRIKKGNLVSDGLGYGALTAALSLVLGINKLTTEYVKRAIQNLALATATIIFTKGYRMTYYTNRSYISTYLEARPTDPFYKYWDSIYTNSSRTNLINEKEYTSGPPR